MEVGEREVTLDDLHTMDLNKLDAWNLVIEVVAPNLCPLYVIVVLRCL
jgi:hypothetical protein